MPYTIETATDSTELEIGVSFDQLQQQVQDLLTAKAARYRRLWMYYRNPMLPRTSERDEQGSDRPYRQAQEWGLPSRMTGVRVSAEASDPLLGAQNLNGIARKEIVIENDIGWRIETMIDFLFGQPFVIRSGATDPRRREAIESLLNKIISSNGGPTFFQHMALLGAVYGFVDVLVKLDTAKLDRDAMEHQSFPDANTAASSGAADEDGAAPASPAGPAPAANVNAAEALDGPNDSASPTPPGEAPLLFADAVRFEIVEPARALPLLSPTNWRDVRAYVQVHRTQPAPAERRPPQPRWLRALTNLAAARAAARPSDTTALEILTATRWLHYENGKLVASGQNSLGEIPLVHVQNVPVPFQYSGAGDVEPLIPIQDELNTRLSDRANRITMQSFKMYLGKGIDGFNNLPIAPGRMWATDNETAEVVEFGGDSSCPSEDHHIAELREAMDKCSGVTPIAAGAVRGRIGHLTSAAALRVTMMALLAKTQRKRLAYGAAIQRMCELSLAWLDKAGLFHTTPGERRIEIHWPQPLAHLFDETQSLRS